MNTRKAQGLPLNTIIIAILVVVVLVVVILLFVGSMGSASKSLSGQVSNTCAEKGGFCTTSEFCTSIMGSYDSSNDCGSGKVCCYTGSQTGSSSSSGGKSCPPGQKNC